MKALLYKEFKLAMHPICYIFIFLFPFMVLIPNYPVSINFIYILTTYPILFLGANKGQQSNDLLYSTLLPVRKKDIVLARMITVIIIQFTSIILSSSLVPLSIYINNIISNKAIESGGAAVVNPGLSLNGYLSIVGIVLIGFAIADLIFLPIYYRKGKSIVASSLLTILFFSVYISLFTIVVPYIKGFEWYTNFLCNSGILNQIIVFLIGLMFYIGFHFFIYKISSKKLEKVDF